MKPKGNNDDIGTTLYETKTTRASTKRSFSAKKKTRKVKEVDS